VVKYVSNRSAITKALVVKLKEINGSPDFNSDIAEKAYDRLVFWDEISEFPVITTSIGPERREYQGGGYKDRFLSLTLRCYVKEEDPTDALEGLLQDIETVIDNNGRLAYQDSAGNTQFTQDIVILSIDTDEGVLAPIGVGEILLQVRY
jgi:hypothetical protein